MPFVTLPDAERHYDTRGDTGTPVLLIMGFGVPGHMWRNQVQDLAKQHRVAWFDNQGAGSSRSRARRLVRVRDMSAHAVGLMDHLGWDDAHIVGVSMGGMIAQELALGFRDRVRSLSLLVTHAGGLRNLFPSRRSVSLFARGFLGPKQHRSAALERLIYPEEYLATADRARIKRALDKEVTTAGSTRDRVEQLAAILRHRTASRLPELAGLPTLVVKAGKDVLVRPRECHRLHTLIPGSRLVEFEDAGHAIMHQCADRLNETLLEHFSDADGARAGQ